MTLRSALVVGVLALAGCGGKQALTPPPPALRPEVSTGPKTGPAGPKDCDPIEAGAEPKPLSFDERSIPEGNRLAEQGKDSLRRARSPDTTPTGRQDAVTQAVDQLVTALRADPYNVEATYSLAAAYATIGRNQCTINLLTRLLQLRPHPSKRGDVEAHLDRLLGRKQSLDPDFAELRKDDRFRALIQKMCEGTNDPNCVYGAQRNP